MLMGEDQGGREGQDAGRMLVNAMNATGDRRPMYDLWASLGRFKSAAPALLPCLATPATPAALRPGLAWRRLALVAFRIRCLLVDLRLDNYQM